MLNCRFISKKENASRKRRKGTANYNEIRNAHKIWEYCKASGVDMSNFPEPLYPWQYE